MLRARIKKFWHLTLAALALSFSAGCGSNNEKSVTEQLQELQEPRIERLKSAGAKMTKKQYPQGEAWSIDMRGMTITDALLDDLSYAGNITEINFSKSTITDDQLAKINDKKIGGFILTLDLSNTAVTDNGLSSLKDLGLLTTLNVSGTKVTAAAVDKFKKDRASDPRIKPLFKNTRVIRG